MKIKRFILGPIQANCYVACDQSKQEGVVIDPSVFDRKVIDFIQKESSKIKYIFLTHGHFDHVTGAATMARELSAKICLHPADLSIMPVEASGRVHQMGSSFEKFKPDIELEDNQHLKIGALDFTVLHTPGHSPGGVCFYEKSQGILFSGDTVFKNGYGRTDLPGGSEEQLFASIKNKILTLPDEVRIYPGHGEETSLGEERVFFEKFSI